MAQFEWVHAAWLALAIVLEIVAKGSFAGEGEILR